MAGTTTTPTPESKPRTPLDSRLTCLPRCVEGLSSLQELRILGCPELSWRCGRETDELIANAAYFGTPGKGILAAG